MNRRHAIAVNLAAVVAILTACDGGGPASQVQATSTSTSVSSLPSHTPTPPGGGPSPTSIASAPAATATPRPSGAVGTATATRALAPAASPTEESAPAPQASATPASTPTASPTATATASPVPASSDARIVTIGQVTFGAEYATTIAVRSLGLSHRESLPAKTGMLFIFEDRHTTSFWMKDMKFSLDFVWISQDCRVVDITRNVPHPAPNQTDLPLYASAVPAAYNFEINAGEADKYGLRLGDVVVLKGVPDGVGPTC